MKIAAINGSPKGDASNSREVISIIQSMSLQEAEWTVVTQIREENNLDSFSFDALFAADVLIIAFPLYVDGMPASLMKFLSQYAKGVGAFRKNMDSQRVFAVANCGFYEGIQNELALEMTAHFCAEAGLEWCGGVGIGTGEMILGIQNVPLEAGIRKPVIAALAALASAVDQKGRPLEKNIYTQHGFPWILYKLAGEMGWRSRIKKNGLAPRDINARPLLDALR